MLTTNAFEDWALKLWDFDRPYRWPGKALGTGTQIGMATGVALAHRGTGRLVVDCQTDGDLMFDVGALWFAAKHKMPFLIVMHNNRAYYNDWEHQISLARQRGTPVERAYIGMDIFDPAPDFAALARGFGWHAEGPIEDPDDIAGALDRAIAKVKSGVPALIDTITQHARVIVRRIAPMRGGSHEGRCRRDRGDGAGNGRPSPRQGFSTVRLSTSAPTG